MLLIGVLAKSPLKLIFGVLSMDSLKVAVIKTESFAVSKLSGWLWLSITSGEVISIEKVILSTEVSFPSWTPDDNKLLFPARSTPLTDTKWSPSATIAREDISIEYVHIDGSPELLIAVSVTSPLKLRVGVLSMASLNVAVISTVSLPIRVLSVWLWVKTTEGWVVSTVNWIVSTPVSSPFWVPSDKS